MNFLQYVADNGGRLFDQRYAVLLESASDAIASLFKTISDSSHSNTSIYLYSEMLSSLRFGSSLPHHFSLHRSFSSLIVG